MTCNIHINYFDKVKRKLLTFVFENWTVEKFKEWFAVFSKQKNDAFYTFEFFTVQLSNGKSYYYDDKRGWRETSINDAN